MWKTWDIKTNLLKDAQFLTSVFECYWKGNGKIRGFPCYLTSTSVVAWGVSSGKSSQGSSACSNTVRLNRPETLGIIQIQVLLAVRSIWVLNNFPISRAVHINLLKPKNFSKEVQRSPTKFGSHFASDGDGLVMFCPYWFTKCDDGACWEVRVWSASLLQHLVWY